MGEDTYLNLLKLTLAGDPRPSRTGTPVRSIFAPPQMVFDISKSIPVLTTKFIPWQKVVGELLWFLKGQTNVASLHEKGIHIWDANSSRKFLDEQSLPDLQEGDIGAGYGFQWRHFGATYVDCHTDYTGKGVDQIANIIQTLKTNPTDRRMVLSAWCPGAPVALPPCHMMAQFYVSRGELHCHMYQRSVDIFLGCPWNILSYSFLVYILANICDLTPGTLTISMGDVHIYENQIAAAEMQLERTTFPAPTLILGRKLTGVDDLVLADFIMVGYKAHSSIFAKMAV